MRTIGATEAKQKLGMVLDAARQEPIAITKHGRPVAVVVTIEDNQRLEQAVLDRPLEEVESTRLLDEISRNPVALVVRCRQKVPSGWEPPARNTRLRRTG